MSLQYQHNASGDTVYYVLRNPSSQVYNHLVGFQDYNAGNWVFYAGPMSEQGATKFYYASMASLADVPAAAYNVTYYKRVGGSSAITDTILHNEDIYWDGSSGWAPGVTDWTTAEKTQIRTALGITGSAASTTGSGVLDTAKKLLEADQYVDTSVTPWVLYYMQKGTGGIGTGTVLMKKSLKTVSGSSVDEATDVVGQQVHLA